MNLKEIKDLVRAISSSNLTEFKYEHEGLKQILHWGANSFREEEITFLTQSFLFPISCQTRADLEGPAYTNLCWWENCV